MNRWLRFLIVTSLIVFCLALVGHASAKTDKSAQIAMIAKLLEKITAYEEGQSRESLIELESIVRQSHDSPKLIKQIEERTNYQLTLYNADLTPQQEYLTSANKAATTTQKCACQESESRSYS